MATLPSDYTIVGTVLALAVAILLLSGLALYVAFRVRETLRDERGGGARAAKVAFLIGLLFLSGGVFYFFASGFNAPGGNTSTQGITSATTTSATSSSISTSASTTSTATKSTATSTTQVQGVSMPAPTCASSRVTAGSTFQCSFTVYNQGSATFSGGTIVSGGDFSKFTFLSCSETYNGASTGSVSTTSTSIAVGNIAPGTTILACAIQAPAQSGQYSNSVLTLNAVGLSQPISVTFPIQVTA